MATALCLPPVAATVLQVGRGGQHNDEQSCHVVDHIVACVRRLSRPRRSRASSGQASRRPPSTAHRRCRQRHRVPPCRGANRVADTVDQPECPSPSAEYADRKKGDERREHCDKDDVDDALGARQRPRSSLIHFRCRNENRDKADPRHQKESEDQRLNPADHDVASLPAAGLHVAIVGVQRHRVRAHSPRSVECLGRGSAARLCCRSSSSEKRRPCHKVKVYGTLRDRVPVSASAVA